MSQSKKGEEKERNEKKIKGDFFLHTTKCPFIPLRRCRRPYLSIEPCP